MADTELKKEGDLCRVITSNGTLGDTLYVVAWVSDRGFHCVIRQAGRAPNGKPYARQDFDASLLRKVEG